MSTLTLTRRGVASVTSADGAGPKDVTITGLKAGSSFRITNVRDRRRDAFVQHGSIAITDADVSPKDSAALGTAVDTACSHVTNVTIREKRTNNIYGATVKLNTASLVRATFGTVAAGDTIDIDFDVVEFKARRGATARILNDTTIRIEWDGTLQAGETIDVSYECVDLEDIGDLVLEADFKLARLLALQGDGKLQDLCVYDTPGNLVSYRVRAFDTAAHASAATVDLAAGRALETGELARYLVTVDIDKETNDRMSLIAVRVDNLAATPGVS